jgi:iron(III) transport system substrate-binding protein
LSSTARWLAGLLLSCTAAAAFGQGEVDVICSVPIIWCQAMAAAFQRDTGITVSVVQKSTGEAVARIAYERTDPRHDVWYAGAGDQHLQAANLGLTEEYRSPMLPELHDWAVRQAEQSRWHTVAIHAGILAIAYNGDLLAKKKQPAPACWKDLARPEYRNDVEMGDPHSSSTAYATIATLVQLFGEDSAFALLRGIHRNIRDYRRTEDGAIRAVARGEAVLAVTFVHDAVTEIVNGFPIKLVSPCEGTGYAIGSMSIIKGAPNLENAKRFYDWALTPAAQRIGVDTRNFQMPSNRATPMPSAVPQMSEVRLIAFDFAAYGSVPERRRLLERWDREVRDSPR